MNAILLAAAVLVCGHDSWRVRSCGAELACRVVRPHHWAAVSYLATVHPDPDVRRSMASASRQCRQMFMDTLYKDGPTKAGPYWSRAYAARVSPRSAEEWAEHACIMLPWIGMNYDWPWFDSMSTYPEHDTFALYAYLSELLRQGGPSAVPAVLYHYVRAF